MVQLAVWESKQLDDWGPPQQRDCAWLTLANWQQPKALLQGMRFWWQGFNTSLQSSC